MKRFIENGIRMQIRGRRRERQIHITSANGGYRQLQTIIQFYVKDRPPTLLGKKTNSLQSKYEPVSKKETESKTECKPSWNLQIRNKRYKCVL